MALPSPDDTAPAWAAPAIGSLHRPRPGELTAGWSVAMILGWLGVVVGFAAVWGVSRQIGLSTWWIGPKAQPRPLPVSLLPFVPALLMITGIASRIRYLPAAGIAASLLLFGVALGDLGRVRGLAIVELALAGAAFAISVAAWSGMYRRVTGPEPTDSR